MNKKKKKVVAILAGMLWAVTAGWAGGADAGASAEAKTGASAGDLYQPGERAVWVFQQDGKRLGTHVMEYAGPVELNGETAYHFRTSVQLDAVGQIPRQRYSGELWTDAAGHPLRHVLQVMLGESYSRVDLRVTGGKVHADIVQGPSEKKMDVDFPEGGYLQANNFIGYFEILFGLLRPNAATPLSVRLFSSNILRTLPYEAHVAREFSMEEKGGMVTGQVFEDSLGETVWISSAGRLVRLEAPSSKLVVERRDEEAELLQLEAPRRAAQADLDREEVEIVHGDVTLAGTITRPPHSSGRLPAVFFISGSGGQDRNGVGGGLDTGTHEILDYLTQRGLLVLRVDDRGVGGSHGPTEGMGYTDLVDDARAAVDFLFERQDVDPKRVALIGHSEGGETALILGGERPVAAVVLMATAGRPLLEVLMDQNADALRGSGVEGADLEAQLATIRAGLERLAGNDPIQPGELPAEFATLLAHRKWVQDHARDRPLKQVAALRCPVLILQGGKDFQVSPDKDARALEQALDQAGNPDHALRIFPELDHLFKRAEGETSDLRQYYDKRPVDAEFLEVLGDWLVQHLRPANAAPSAAE